MKIGQVTWNYYGTANSKLLELKKKFISVFLMLYDAGQEEK
jgi:hypothetical protein